MHVTCLFAQSVKVVNEHTDDEIEREQGTNNDEGNKEPCRLE